MKSYLTALYKMVKIPWDDCRAWRSQPLKDKITIFRIYYMPFYMPSYIAQSFINELSTESYKWNHFKDSTIPRSHAKYLIENYGDLTKRNKYVARTIWRKTLTVAMNDPEILNLLSPNRLIQLHNELNKYDLGVKVQQDVIETIALKLFNIQVLKIDDEDAFAVGFRLHTC